MTTEELLQRCINKDAAAWDEFVKLYRGIVIRSVRYKLRKMNSSFTKAQVQDIVQEIFLSIWSKDKLSNVKSPSSLKGWLAILSINAVFNYFKNKSSKVEENMLSIDEYPSLDPILSSPNLSTGKTLESNELGRIIDDEVSKLSIKQQLAVKFHLYHGRTQKDTAKIMNIPKNTVVTLINRAKKELKKNLKEVLDYKS